jgi:ribose 5-phosphate isomerase B
MNNDMKIYISADHRGVGLKLYLIEMLTAAGYRVENLGTDDPKTMVDYPEITRRVTDALLDDTGARGIVVCGSGGGAVIAANRFRHIRATRVDRPEQAREDRFHNDINVIALGADDIDPEVAMLCVQEFLDAPFDAVERRVRRIKEIS